MAASKTERASLRLTEQTTKSVLKLCFSEKRSFNQMIEILVEEALALRNKGGKK